MIYLQQDDKSERRVSAATRLFPHQPGGATTHTNSRDSVRRISDMFSPRPFTTGATWQKQQEAASNTFSVSRQGSGATVATVRPVVNHVNIRAERQAQTISMDSRSFEAANKDYGVRGMSRSSENLGVIQKDDLVKEYWEDRKRNRHMPRGRYMTISSTQPAKMEQTHERWKPSTHHSAAGDLILGVSENHSAAGDLILGVSENHSAAGDLILGLSENHSAAGDLILGVSENHSAAGDLILGVSENHSAAGDLILGVSENHSAAGDLILGVSENHSAAGDLILGVSENLGWAEALDQGLLLY